jgi:hypothetical protein
MSNTCKECGSTDLAWHCTTENRSGVVDGRLRMHDISTIFYLGCESCSGTLKVISGDEAAEQLAENARLQEALEEIANYKSMADDNKIIRGMKYRASKALQP